ncbi:MAG: acyl-CoA thioesterase [Desulfamplus sp.]|nr:acyl-CoA thioesterase [Desulfamplus sp.]
MKNSFRYYLRVRYSECDAQKVVFNSRYGDYVELGTAEFMRSLGYETELVSGQLDYQLVKQTLEWRSPARFDQVLELTVENTHLGNTSFTLRTEFRRPGNEQIIALVETVYVLVDSQTLNKIPLSQDFRYKLANGASGKIVDHAGYLRNQKS